MSNNVVFTYQDIQWHLHTTAHDKCPKCGGRLGYLKDTSRACMGKCTDGLTWNLRDITPEGWFDMMMECGEVTEPLTRAPKYRSDT